MKQTGQEAMRAGLSTSEVEQVQNRANPSLLEERSADSIAADELHERVVERQEPIVAGRGKIRPPTSAGRSDHRRHRCYASLSRDRARARAGASARRSTLPFDVRDSSSTI